ncbi:MAG TPA: c-type cytochrome [Longimicrobiaceae bacterium]|jgi:mono/diheme cytochrome c family protein|nr:c-type cytochrome [Longimicrobiaceae bacterium]
MAAVLVAAAACGKGAGAGGGADGQQAEAPVVHRAAPPGAMPQGVAADAGTEGQQIFAERCVVCHGENGEGTQLGSALTDTAWTVAKGGSFEEIGTVVRNGAPGRKDEISYMPASHELTDAQVRAVAAYTYSLSHKQ